MFFQTKTGMKDTPGVVELVVDNDADVLTLPTHYAPGSTCIVVATSSVYMLNNQKVWTQL